MLSKVLTATICTGSMFYGALYSLELPEKHMNVHTLQCIKVDSINPLLNCSNIKPPYQPVYVWRNKEKR